MRFETSADAGAALRRAYPPRRAPGRLVDRIAGPEPHHRAITTNDQPISIVLDFVHPAGTGRWLLALHRLVISKSS
jgi:hypothetical protein